MSEALRIGLVSQEYPPETARGGIGSQTFLKAHGLAARGHNVVVVSQSVDDRRQVSRDGKVTVVRVPMRQCSTTGDTEVVQWLTYSAQVAAVIAELHERAPFDLIDFPEWGCEAYVHLLNQVGEDRVPVTIHLHGPLVMFAHSMGWPEIDSDFYRVGTHMEGTCLRLADAVYSSSYCSADWCARFYGLSFDQIPRLHTGVDTQAFHPEAGAKSARPTIVFTGKIARNKGVIELLDAACDLLTEFPDLRLLVLGRGDREVIDQLRTLAKRRGVEHVLEMPGFVRRDELPRQLAQAHVFAAPSIYEGGPGLVYLEAMACGLPVIACEGSGASEVVTHQDNGLLVPPSDSSALAAVLRRLISDREKREAMGHRARAFAVSEADSQSCLDRLESFYREVALGVHAKNSA